MKVLVVYVGKDSAENFDHGINNGVWGFKASKRPKDEFGPGDYILFARGFSGGSPRCKPDEWAIHSMAEVAWAKITSGLEKKTLPEWPDERRAGDVIYPYRLTFEDVHRNKGPILLKGAMLPPDLTEALRLSAIANMGYVRTLARWPFEVSGNETSPLLQPPQVSVIEPPPELMRAEDLLIEIGSFCASRGFIFERKTLLTFYAALRAKPFVIFAGNSGTGKSKLVRLFAEAVGATTDNNQFCMIPVKPDWNDSSELIGFFDLNGDFVPGRLVGPILLAHQTPTKPFFVCLDEMNLARVEHYFSDFLSIIESRRRSGGEVTTDSILREAHLQKIKPDGLPQTVVDALANLRSQGKPLGLPENLFVVGTVNMDETTQPFSRKVLDRASTIEFNDIDLLQGLDEEVDPGAVPALDIGQASFRSEYIMLNDCLVEHREKARDIAGMIHELNHDLGLAGFEVGYRVRDESIAFALYAGRAGLSDEDTRQAIVLQKILPRVQGSSPRVQKLLMGLLKRLKGDSDVPDENDPELATKLAELRVDVDASAVIRKIAGMLILFHEENFTSFWLA